MVSAMPKSTRCRKSSLFVAALVAALASEAAVDASTGGWFYDAARRHLIVKLTQLGSACPGGFSLSLPGLLGP